MKIQGKVGTQRLSDGVEADMRLSRSGSVVTSQSGGQYTEASLGGNMYIGSDLGGTAVTTQGGLSATTPALTLYNPVGSGVNLSLMTVTIGVTASPAAAATFMLAYNLATAAAPTLTTLANVTNAQLTKNGQPIGQCARVSTLAAAPLAFRFLGGTAGAAGIESTNLVDHVDGEVIIPPGVAISVQSTSAAAILASFTWEEIII